MNKNAKIIFVDDDIKAGELMMRFSEGANYDVKIFQDPGKALNYFKEQHVNLIISDLRMPSMTGMELLAKIRKLDSDLPFIIITGYANIDDAIEAVRLGATDFIKKPFDMDEMQILINRTLERQALVNENQMLKQQLSSKSNNNLIGDATAMQKVYQLIDKIADIRCNVIIEGESGTGKELMAQSIHQQSHFADTPFVIIDCGSLSDSLLESELFGHEKGAFTGAIATKHGLLESASGGTVFLDEIGNISDAMQTKLLRVIQEQQITRVGGVHSIAIDVRFIVATNRNLIEMIASNTFRDDLYHRLNVINITMPSLRERREDIPLLINHFIQYFAKHYNRSVSHFDPESLKQLRAFDWPGNVRELRNLVERHIALADKPILHLQALNPRKDSNQIDADNPSLQELEQRYILKTLQRFDGNRELTATTLGINKSTLWRKLQAQRHSDLDD
ncbi:Response regulator of zinc sigma-54-dependent two-component system [hydrothermal vent metagenome]|uniref:Response regulator of zinc sigma-54-dependent two-component system n=1 Tax=hydrothermal vent metagenome TaxID=652676 RepID=A0A3B0ZMI4_9ZZZZ